MRPGCNAKLYQGVNESHCSQVCFSAVSGRAFLDGCHVGAEHSVHSRLVPRALLLEPPQDILIDAKRDGLLGRRMNEGGL